MSEITVTITGAQGSGKTQLATFLKDAIGPPFVLVDIEQTDERVETFTVTYSHSRSEAKS